MGRWTAAAAGAALPSGLLEEPALPFAAACSSSPGTPSPPFPTRSRPDRHDHPTRGSHDVRTRPGRWPPAPRRPGLATPRRAVARRGPRRGRRGDRGGGADRLPGVPRRAAGPHSCARDGGARPGRRRSRGRPSCGGPGCGPRAGDRAPDDPGRRLRQPRGPLRRAAPGPGHRGRGERPHRHDHPGPAGPRPRRGRDAVVPARPARRPLRRDPRPHQLGVLRGRADGRGPGCQLPGPDDRRAHRDLHQPLRAGELRGLHPGGRRGRRRDVLRRPPAAR